MESTHREVCAKLAFDGHNVFTLKSGSYLIGNKSSKEVIHDIGINDPSLETKHAVIVISDGSIQIMDLFSQHGTYIDGKRLKRFEVVELSKPLKVQFGNVSAHLTIIHETDDGLLGLNDSTKDTSFVPETPKTGKKPNTSRTLNRSQSSTTNSTILDERPSSQLAHNEVEEDEDIFVKATQVSNENNISVSKQLTASLLEEDMDYFIPETQDFVNKEHLDVGVDDSCDMFQLNTQDFNEGNENSNNSDDLLGNISFADSMIIPLIEPQKLSALPEEKKEENILTVHNEFAAKPSLGNNDDNDSDTDCEEELSSLGLVQKEKYVTSVPDNERSGSVTPDLNIGEQELDKDMLEPTQAFIKPNLNKNIVNPPTSQTCKDMINRSNLNLDETETFVVPAAIMLKANKNNSFGSLEQTQMFQPPPQKESHNFSVPSIVEFDRIKKPSKKAITEESNDECIEPTQIFKQPNAKLSTTKPDSTSEDLNDLEATQKFIMSTSVPTCSRRKSQSPVLLDSDEEDKDSQFCLAETLLIDDRPKIVCNTNSSNLPQKANRINRLFGSDDEEECPTVEKTPKVKSNLPRSKSPSIWDDAMMQPTPDFEFFKLPSINKLDEADAIFHAKSKRIIRCKTLLELSSDEDDENDPVNQVNIYLRGKTAGENSRQNKLNACSSRKEDHQKRKHSVRKSSSSTSPGVAKKESRSSSSHRSTSKERDIAQHDKRNVHNKESPEKRGHKRSRSPPRGPRDEKQQKLTSISSKPKTEKRELRNNKKAETSPTKTSSENIREKSRSDSKTEKTLRDGDHKKTESSASKLTSEKNAEGSKRNSSRETIRHIAKEEKSNKKTSRTDNEKRGRRHKHGNCSSSLNEEVNKGKIKTEKDEKTSCELCDHLIYFVTKKNHNKLKKTTCDKCQDKLVEVKIPINNFPELPKCKVILQKKMIDHILECNGDATKKRGNSVKAKSEVPRKRNKENDPSNIRPVEENDVINPIRKSNRSVKPRILFTKMDSRPHEKTIERIGGIIVQDPVDCTVLVTHKISLTWKLLSAIGKGIPIVSDKWLRDALESKYQHKNNLPNCDDYLIKDKKQEARFNFNLRESLKKASKSPVFEGYTFHCTPNTNPTPKQMKSIIECCGGKMIKRITKDFTRPDKFFVVSNEKDIATWAEIRKQIGNTPILDSNAILKVIMQQRVCFESYLIP